MSVIDTAINKLTLVWNIRAVGVYDCVDQFFIKTKLAVIVNRTAMRIIVGINRMIHHTDDNRNDSSNGFDTNEDTSDCENTETEKTLSKLSRE